MAAAVSKSTRTFRSNFRGDGGKSLALGMLRKVPFENREVVLCQKNDMKKTFKRKILSAAGGKMGAKENKIGLLWATSTAAAAANVTNAIFKTSPVPLSTT